MAAISYKTSLGLRDPHELFDASTLGIQSWSDAKLVLKDWNGAGAVLKGSDFEVSTGTATAGVATSVTLYDATGDVLMTVRHAYLDVGTISANLEKYRVTALLWTFAAGDDHVTGTRFADDLQGDYGNDIVSGGGGNDLLDGYSGQDRVEGGAGRDRIDGGWDNDILVGGQGADTFVFKKGWGVDTIADWQDSAKQGDKILLGDTGMWQRMEMHQQGRDLVLDFGYSDQLVIRHEKASEITEGDFIFAA